MIAIIHDDKGLRLEDVNVDTDESREDHIKTLADKLGLHG